MDLIGGLITLVIWGVGGVVSLVALCLWIYALIDCVKREFPGENEKLIWILVIVLANWIGALIYLFVGKPKGRLV